MTKGATARRRGHGAGRGHGAEAGRVQIYEHGEFKVLLSQEEQRLPASDLGLLTPNMATLLRRLPALSRSPRPWTQVILRETLIPRCGAPLLTGEGVPLPACGRAQSRRQHADASAALEVDVRRLEGEDDGTRVTGQEPT